MRVAVIGSRTLSIQNLHDYLPPDVTEIVSGGAQGIDSCAHIYAIKHQIPLREFFPQYEKYGSIAPLKRNIEIIMHADLVIAFWDGHSHGTMHVIRNCRRLKVPYRVYMPISKIHKAQMIDE